MRIYEFNLFRRGTEGDADETEYMRVNTDARTDHEALRRIREDYFEDEWGLAIGWLPDGFVICSGPTESDDEEEPK